MNFSRPFQARRLAMLEAKRLAIIEARSLAMLEARRLAMLVQGYETTGITGNLKKIIFYVLVNLIQEDCVK